MKYHDTITVVRAPVIRDRWDNDTADWAAATRTVVVDVLVLPSSQIEDAAGNRIAVATGWRLYSAPGVDVDLRASDRVEWQGLSLEVIGEVGRWPHPLRPATIHHIEAELRRMEG